MLVITKMERVFLVKENGKEIKLADPDQTMSPEAVMDFYSGRYSFLTTAKVGTPKIEEDQLIYRFESVVGTKG